MLIVRWGNYRKKFFLPLKNLRTEGCQIDRSSFDFACFINLKNLAAKNNVWKKKKEKEKKKKIFLRCRKLALACWSAVGTLKRRFLSLHQYVDLSNWTTGVDHWSANSWLFEGSGLIRTNLDRPGSRFGHLLLTPVTADIERDNLLISKQASVNFWYSCGSCVFKSSSVDFDGFFSFIFVGEHRSASIHTELYTL